MMRRTTVVAEDDDLEVIAREARTQGLSLGRMLGEFVAEKARELRRQRRPHLGTFRAGGSITELMEAEDPAARPFRD